MKKNFLILGILGLVLLAGCSQQSDYTQEDITTLAQCLTQNEIIMYGAFWCPHCADQKELFGDAFEEVTYVECDPRDEAGEPERCLAEGIESYPTWMHPDGRRWEGRQSLEVLSEISGCPLPELEEETEE